MTGREPYSPKHRTALVLTGTGTAGAYHAGVLRALAEAGVRIDLVAGRALIRTQRQVQHRQQFLQLLDRARPDNGRRDPRLILAPRQRQLPGCLASPLRDLGKSRARFNAARDRMLDGLTNFYAGILTMVMHHRDEPPLDQTLERASS